MSEHISFSNGELYRFVSHIARYCLPFTQLHAVFFGPARA